MQSIQRSITVTSEGRKQTFSGDVDIRKIEVTGSFYILQNGSVAWQQRVENGQVAAAEFAFEGFDEEYLRTIM